MPASAPKSMTKTYAAGETIIAEGAHDTPAYLILNGLVEISKTLKNHKVILARAGKNELLGEMSFIDHERRSATAKALESTTVLIFTKDLLELELRKVQPWFSGFVRVLVERARQADYLINPMTPVAYAAAALKMLHYLFCSEGKQEGETTIIDANEAETEILSTLFMEREQFYQLEQLLFSAKIIGIQLQRIFPKAYLLQSPSRLKALAKRITSFSAAATDQEPPLVLVKAATQLIEKDEEQLSALAELIGNAADKSLSLPVEKAAKASSALKDLDKLAPKFAPPGTISVSGSGEQATLSIQASSFKVWRKTLIEERMQVEFLSKFFSSSFTV